MPLVHTNLFINFANFTFTPTGGVVVNIARVTAGKPNRDGKEEAFKGDAAKYNQAVAVPLQERSIDVDFGDVFACMSIPIGVPGVMTMQLADATNGLAAGGGGFTITLGPCVATKNPSTGDHGKFANTTLTFVGYNADGVTDPMTVALIV